jgi:hypothetical protein
MRGVLAGGGGGAEAGALTAGDGWPRRAPGGQSRGSGLPRGELRAPDRLLRSREICGQRLFDECPGGLVLSIPEWP